jgi:CHAT domain-containing protein
VDVLARIRSLQGFESFLEPVPFSILQASAAEGPVIVLNISTRRSDAIIIRQDGPPRSVALCGAKPDVIAHLAEKAHATTTDKDFKIVLSNIWSLIVKPVVDVLREDPSLKPGSRIWWCPTGSASHLPLHAAGDYRGRGQNLPDVFISSYTPTLSTLLRARKNTSDLAQSTANPTILLIAQSQDSTLPSVQIEIDRIKSVAQSVSVVDQGAAKRESVLAAMKRCSCVHLACHGYVDQEHPFKSHFSLNDGPLTLLDIARQNIPNAHLAFLSACHSAEGNRDRPDEVLHLTAGVQFAGFRSVVGTLWAVDDEDGPDVAETFYSNLLASKGRAGVSSALALHRAIRKLRMKNVSSTRWACFVHYGC